MIKVILFFLGIVTNILSSGVERRQKLFNITISELLNRNECFFNNQLIDLFNFNLESNKLGIRKNRIEYKMEMDRFLNAFNYEKVWRHEFDKKYRICIKEENYRNIHIPNKTIQITNLSIPFTFEQYPYLKNHISHINITKMLNHLPYNLKCVMKMVRYTIYQNKMYLQTYPSQKFIWNLMDKIMEDLQVQLPNVDFVIYSRSQIHQRFIFEQFNNDFGNSQALFDGNVELTKKIIVELPAFMMSKDLNGSLQFNKLLIVDCEIAQFPWKDALRDIKIGEEKYTWQDKIEKGFWRGDPTGKPYDYTDYWTNIPMYFPRLNLVDISQKNFDYLDAKFTLEQDIPLYKIKAHNISVAVEHTPLIHQQLRYKYLINVDGWSANWLTLPWMLALNSLVLKQQTSKVQWFYNEIKPYIHYIPLQYNFSDVLLQITQLRQNDQIALTISNNAQQYIKENLMPLNIKQKLLKMLQEYAQVQNLELALYQKITIKYKNHLRRLKKGILLLLAGIFAWRFYLVFPKVKDRVKNSFIWKGIHQYFEQERPGYNRVDQQ